ncbi:hypothetical protein QBC46DRAFT_402436 [Diplogelasinospora grovesii]|uniref:Uncharacterized protein n=1 Tax=Diplogelasinospora grovesii TaxID=303347 RepID=A0AAN6MU97_9PEZI|nr:hypothetical protein QBC46DRAFT_402436 [Diplogelasinospora grovesii]
MAESLIGGLHAILRGRRLKRGEAGPGYDWVTVPQSDAATAFDSAVEALQKSWKETRASGDDEISHLDKDEVPELFPQKFEDCMQQVIRIRWSPAGYDRRDPKGAAEMDKAFRAVSDLYFTPHMFRETELRAARQGAMAVSELEEVSSQIPDYERQASRIFDAVYRKFRDKILDMLDRFHHWVMEEEDENLLFGNPRIPRHGHCCETYPLAALMPTYFPRDRILPASSDNPHPQQSPNPNEVSKVRTFAFDVRCFNDECGLLLEGVWPYRRNRLSVP